MSIINYMEILIRAENGHVRITIRDTGCGILQENILKIFDPFFTTRKVGKIQ
jgi:signal transduction histidine kinase